MEVVVGVLMKCCPLHQNVMFAKASPQVCVPISALSGHASCPRVALHCVYNRQTNQLFKKLCLFRKKSLIQTQLPTQRKVMSCYQHSLMRAEQMVEAAEKTHLLGALPASPPGWGCLLQSAPRPPVSPLLPPAGCSSGCDCCCRWVCTKTTWDSWDRHFLAFWAGTEVLGWSRGGVKTIQETVPKKKNKYWKWIQ